MARNNSATACEDTAQYELLFPQDEWVMPVDCAARNRSLAFSGRASKRSIGMKSRRTPAVVVRLTSPKPALLDSIVRGALGAFNLFNCKLTGGTTEIVLRRSAFEALAVDWTTVGIDMSQAYHRLAKEYNARLRKKGLSLQGMSRAS